MVVASEERIKKLEKILVNYSNLLSEFGNKDQIVEAFKFQKPSRKEPTVKHGQMVFRRLHARREESFRKIECVRFTRRD